MRYRDTCSLHDLIKDALGDRTAQPSTEHAIMRAWYTILPSTKDHVQRTFIKGKALYIKLGSPLLQHQLYLERDKIRQALRDALQRLGSNPHTIDQIFFM